MKSDVLAFHNQAVKTAVFEPYREACREDLFRNNRATEKLPESLKKKIASSDNLKHQDLAELLNHSAKAEDWLEICFYSERNHQLNHEVLWTSGLEKFNNSAIYLENLGYFYFQKQKYHKSLEYLARSHALEHSFFALSLAIAAAYAVTQYHLVIEYFLKLGEKDMGKLNEDLLVKVATSALHTERYDLSMKIFEKIQVKKNARPLPDLQKFLIGRFGSEKEMHAWKKKISDKITTSNPGAVSLDDSITLASILMHEDKFDLALEHLLHFKSENFDKKGR